MLVQIGYIFCWKNLSLVSDSYSIMIMNCELLKQRHLLLATIQYCFKLRLMYILSQVKAPRNEQRLLSILCSITLQLTHCLTIQGFSFLLHLHQHFWLTEPPWWIIWDCQGHPADLDPTRSYETFGKRPSSPFCMPLLNLFFLFLAPAVLQNMCQIVFSYVIISVCGSEGQNVHLFLQKRFLKQMAS